MENKEREYEVGVFETSIEAAPFPLAKIEIGECKKQSDERFTRVAWKLTFLVGDMLPIMLPMDIELIFHDRKSLDALISATQACADNVFGI